jgi:hypothetical protein
LPSAAAHGPGRGVRAGAGQRHTSLRDRRGDQAVAHAGGGGQEQEPVSQSASQPGSQAASQPVSQ